MKKILSLFLTVLMLCAVFSAMTLPVSAASGTCGNNGNVHWELNGTTLRIYGNGAMDDYSSYKKTPWYYVDGKYSYKTITKLVIEDGVTKVGSLIFIT